MFVNDSYLGLDFVVIRDDSCNVFAKSTIEKFGTSRAIAFLVIWNKSGSTWRPKEN